MAKKAKPDVRTFDEVKQFRSLDQIDHGIETLERRVEEVKGLANGVKYDDQRRYNVESSIASAIRDVFGPNSPSTVNMDIIAFGMVRIESGSRRPSLRNTSLKEFRRLS